MRRFLALTCALLAAVAAGAQDHTCTRGKHDTPAALYLSALDLTGGWDCPVNSTTCTEHAPATGNATALVDGDVVWLQTAGTWYSYEVDGTPALDSTFERASVIVGSCTGNVEAETLRAVANSAASYLHDALDGTLRTVETGAGDDTPLSLSTTTVGAANLLVDPAGTAQAPEITGNDSSFGITGMAGGPGLAGGELTLMGGPPGSGAACIAGTPLNLYSGAAHGGTGACVAGPVIIDSGNPDGETAGPVQIGVSTAAAVQVGNATATFEVESSAFDVSNTGAVSGVTTQTLAGPITVGTDMPGGSPNVAGQIKLVSAGDNAWYTTITSGTNATGNIAYVMPTDAGGGLAKFLQTNGTGTLSWQAESDPKVGDVTVNKWCVGTGTQSSCTETAPAAADHTQALDKITDAATTGQTLTSGGAGGDPSWTATPTLGVNGVGGIAGSTTLCDGANPGTCTTLTQPIAARINVATPGTAEASKAVVLNSSADITAGLRNLTTTGTITSGALMQSAGLADGAVYTGLDVLNTDNPATGETTQGAGITVSLKGSTDSGSTWIAHPALFIDVEKYAADWWGANEDDFDTKVMFRVAQNGDYGTGWQAPLIIAGTALYGYNLSWNVTDSGSFTITDAAIGGGHGGSGATISSAGAIDADGAITSGVGISTDSGPITAAAGQITPAAGTGITVSANGTLSRSVYTVSVTYAALQAAATEKDLTIGTLGARGVIEAAECDTATAGAFDGGAATLVLSLGDTGAGYNDYIDGGGGAGWDGLTDVLEGDTDAERGADLPDADMLAFHQPNYSGSTPIILRATTDGAGGKTLANLAAGAWTCHLWYSAPPAG